jgi:formamidase
MATTHHVQIDGLKPLSEQPGRGHNRWHEEIEPLVEVEPGDTVILETFDALDNQLKPGAVDSDVGNVDLNFVHPLTGPVYIKGAEPGDLLEIRLHDIDCDPWENWGFTCQVPGFGFLADLFTEPYIVNWHLVGNRYAESPQLPGVRIPCNPFPGIAGIAPSRELREATTRREQALIDAGGTALPPDPTSAIPSSVGADALRTIPPRETGGNIDIKQLTPGSSLFLPVHAEGALFSSGDVHFAQGDCEACGTAIEIRSALHLEFHVYKGEAKRKNITFPQFMHTDYFAGPELAVPRRFYATTGMPVHPDGTNESGDLTLAARNALLSMIDHLEGRGYSRQQAYTICSVAVDLRVSQVVDVPNFIVSALLPLDIFV